MGRQLKSRRRKKFSILRNQPVLTCICERKASRQGSSVQNGRLRPQRILSQIRHNSSSMKTMIWLAFALLLTIEFGCIRRSHAPLIPLAPGIPLTLQAGTTLALRTAQAIDSSSSRPDRTFAVVVSRDAADASGQTVLPSGSPAVLVLARASTREGAFELRIMSVTLNGDSYLVRNESEAGNSTAAGASLGTFLGGVAGTDQPLSTEPNAAESLQLTVSEARIAVPVGSLLTFRLDRQVRLIGSH